MERKASIKETEDDETSGFGELTLSWQEKKFSPAELKFYSASKEEDCHGDVLKMKFFRDVQVKLLSYATEKSTIKSMNLMLNERL